MGADMVLDACRLLLFPALMAFAASSDLLTMTIPNRIALILIGGYFALALMLGTSPAEVASHVAAGLLVLVVSFGFFARGWIGGGDAKLAAATALWLGFDHLMPYLLYASVLGGILTLVLLQLRTLPLPALLVGRDWAERLHKADGGIPYGIALAGAALLIYPDTSWMRALGA
jgi:prepilin peptidase CpaA